MIYNLKSRLFAIFFLLLDFFFDHILVSLQPFNVSLSSLQSIGFVGPGIALVGLTMAKSPSIASAWLTLAVGLKSFSHSGFLVNLQVGILQSLRTKK